MEVTIYLAMPTYIDYSMELEKSSKRGKGYKIFI